MKSLQILIAYCFLVSASASANTKDVQSPIAISPSVHSFSEFDYSASLGWGLNTYNSSAISMAQYSALINASATFHPESNERLSFKLGAFFTALPLSTSRVLLNGSETSVSIRFLGINAGAGYETPWLAENWKLGLKLGWYFNTTFVTQNLFGYESVTGPQFYPTATYRLSEQSLFEAYFKFSPMMENASFMSLSQNYEVAAGLQYLFPFDFLGSNQSMLQLDFAHLSVKPSQVRVFSNSSSLSFGVLFH